MIELVRANDPALISFIESILDGAGVPYFVADAHASIVDGSISAIQRRVLVAPEFDRIARRALEEAGLQGEIRSAT